LSNNELFFSLQHHTSLSALSKEDLVSILNALLKLTNEYIASSKYLVITWGSAFVYKHIERNEIVANCHKLPQSDFEKSRLSVKQILDPYNRLFELLESANPELQVLFTVSPVRHWKDGAINNSRSKAILLMAADYLYEQFDKASYFPSYEILMDELRDYRFYKKDMLHPNETAVDHIWQLFKSAYLDKESIQFIDQLEPLIAQFNHKPLHPETTRHKSSRKLLLDKMETFQKKYPTIKIESEIQQLKSEVAAHEG